MANLCNYEDDSASQKCDKWMFMLKYNGIGVEMMREKINLIGTKATDEKELKLFISNDLNVENMKPLGQMLVDSDEVSFVYLIEKDNEYTYVMIKEETWPQLKGAIEHNVVVTLCTERGKIELVDFLDELSYLIENIKGNSNYGERMVTKVEEIF